MKKISIYIFLAIICYSCGAYKNSVETKIMNCINENFGNKGTQFKIAIDNYQKLLINEKIIANGTGKSYKKTLNKIANDNSFDYSPSKSFFSEIYKLGSLDTILFITCTIEPSTNKNVGQFKVQKLKSLIDSLSATEKFTAAAYSNGILSILSKKDFEKDYYKIATFPLFSLIRTDAGIDSNYKKASDFDESELKNAMKIHINKVSELFLYKRSISFGELRKAVREYEIKNKSNSIILFTNDDEVKYGSFIKVQNMMVAEIDSIRESFSQKKYGKSFNSLNESQSKKIETLYPKNIL